MEDKILPILSQEMSVPCQQGTCRGDTLGTRDIVAQNFPSTHSCPLWERQFVPISPIPVTVFPWLDLLT